MSYCWGFYGIFVEDIYTCGGALVRGKLNLFEQYPNNPDNHVECWSHCNTLFGDPSLELWTGIPENMSVNYLSEVSLGTNFMEFHVTDLADIPLKDAWITVRGVDYYQSGYTDAIGIYYLDLSGVQENEDYEITVTSHNKIPYESEFNVVIADQNPDIAELNYIDTSGDGIPNPGEEISLEFTIANYGSCDLSDVQAELVSMNDYCSITNSSAFLGDIASGGQTQNSQLSISIDPLTPGGTRTELGLILTSDGETWNLPVFIDISGVLLNINDFNVINGNIIIPGNTATIYFTVENLGQISADEVFGVLNCSDYNVTIMDSIGYFGSVEPDNTADNISNPYQISVNEDAIPGTLIPVDLHFSSNNSADISLSFFLEIGHLNQSDPLGPDQYGYFCYDDSDTAYDDCPVYDWIEILTIGENLNIVSLGDNADIADVILPDDFTFVFYGIEYDLITVCTAGWISPGGSGAADFMNWILPGPGGPSPMIAAFWDDLHNGCAGNVYYFYDDVEHIFIVEWYEMENENNNQDESFEIILYDPNFYATTTGDSKIKIQYREFTNANVGQYPYHGADHGLYCTIGLEDHTATRGLQYTYNNMYPPWAKPLADETAILFTVSSVPGSEPYISIIDMEIISGDDAYLESGEDASVNLTLNNIGYMTASNLSVQMTCSDTYIDIIQGASTVDDLAPGETSSLQVPFLMTISENIPDYYNFFVNFLITSDEGSWQSAQFLTAYHPNTLAVDPGLIDYQIDWGEQASTSFMLSNVGEIPVFYFISIEEISSDRDISGSYLNCNTDSFTPGETTTWSFSVYNASADNEWVSDLWIDFPDGVIVEDATNFIGGSGGEMVWDGSSGEGALLNWHGESSNEWGVLHNGETAEGAVNVTLSNQFVNDLTIAYTIGGDGYGEEPHQVEGEIRLEYPLRWISLNTASGLIFPDEPQEIVIDFDTSEVEEDYHSCNIVITTNAWDTKILPVTLSPINNDYDPDLLPSATVLKHNFPNPFNPKTFIPFTISSYAENVTLKVYNLRGQLIKTLMNSPASSGNYQLLWNGMDAQDKSVASGIYIYRLSVDGSDQTRKMILLK